MCLNTVDNNGLIYPDIVQIQICALVTGPSDMVSNRNIYCINPGGSGDWCVFRFNFQGKSTYGISALALQYCVVDLAVKVYSYEASVKSPTLYFWGCLGRYCSVFTK